MKSRKLLVLPIMGLAAALAACSSSGSSSTSSSGSSPGASSSGAAASSSSGSSATPITVGIADDLSGLIASYGKANQAAWEAVAADVNASGGINGRMIKVVSVDTQADADKTISAIKQLTSENATLISGLTLSNDCAAAASADRSGTVLECGTAANSQIVPVSPLVFVRNPLEVQEVVPLNDLLKGKLGTVRYGLLPADLAGELAWASYLKTVAGQTGGAATQQVLVNGTSNAAQVAAILQFKPNAVILEEDPVDLTQVVHGLREGGYTGMIINLTADYGSVLSLADSNVYVYNDTDFAIPGVSPAVDTFTNGLAKQGIKGAEAINVTNTVNDYLQAMATVQALKACNGCSGAALGAALEKVNLSLPGLTPEGGFGYSASSHLPVKYMMAYLYDAASKKAVLSYALPLTPQGSLPQSAVNAG